MYNICGLIEQIENEMFATASTSSNNSPLYILLFALDKRVYRFE